MIGSILWTVVAVVGLAVQLAYLNDTMADWNYWHASGRNGGFLATARQHLLTALIRTCVVAAYAIVGCLSFTITPDPPRSTWNVIYGLIAIVVLVGGEIALITLTWLDRRLRQHLAEAEQVTLPSDRSQRTDPV